MQKSLIFLLFATCNIVLAALALLYLYPIANEAMLVIASCFLLTLLAPAIVVQLGYKEYNATIESIHRELHIAQSQLANLKVKFQTVTTIDELTGCSNRRHFMEMLDHHKAMSERSTYNFTVAVTQVDRFDAIVEGQGLGRGNEVLQLFSRIIKAAIREVDTVARLDTDKFALILSGCAEEDALRMIGRINELIAQIQVSDKDDVQITASGGMTSFYGTESSEELVAHAEEALAFAVEQGRDRVAGYNYITPETDPVV